MDQRTEMLVQDCAAKRVLHLGCADFPFTEEKLANGTMLHGALKKVASELYGSDLHVASLSLMRENFPNCVFFEPRDTPGDIASKIDVVVAGEILEHVCNFSEFGTELRSYCKNHAELIVTTPNAYSFKGAARALAGREAQHPDHLSLSSPSTLKRLFGQFGFQCIAEQFYNSQSRGGSMSAVSFLIGQSLKLAPRASDGLYFKFRLAN